MLAGHAIGHGSIDAVVHIYILDFTLGMAQAIVSLEIIVSILVLNLYFIEDKLHTQAMT